MSFPFYNHALPLQSLQSGSHNNSHQHSHRSRRGRPHPHNHGQQHFRSQMQAIKEAAETPQMTAFRARFEAAVSFDLDDDLEFCPALLTEEDIVSIHSSPSSDRSSLSSLSPEHSPLQQQIHPLPQVSTFSLASSGSFLSGNSYQPAASPSASAYNASSYFSPASPMKGQNANRSRNVIAIVDPSTGMRMPSPPTSMSPARLPQGLGRSRW